MCHGRVCVRDRSIRGQRSMHEPLGSMTLGSIDNTKKFAFYLHCHVSIRGVDMIKFMFLKDN